MTTQSDAAFTGAVPKIYETYLVPIFFEPYAKDLADRLQKKILQQVLEVAAGTGVVTRFMDTMLPGYVQIVATDLNQAMIDEAAQTNMKRNIEWKQADAMQLPFEDETFDAVVCQFGVMFFPDRSKAYAEAYRVLKPGGVFLFNVWDRLSENDFSNSVNTAMENAFPDDPPHFLKRTPYAYFDEGIIAKDLANGGFKNPPRFETIAFRTSANSADIPATAICLGTPLRNDIESRNIPFEKAVQVAAGEIAKRFGNHNVEGKLQAKVVEVTK